jgi:hypothetical protein
MKGCVWLEEEEGGKSDWDFTLSTQTDSIGTIGMRRRNKSEASPRTESAANKLMHNDLVGAARRDEKHTPGAGSHVCQTQESAGSAPADECPSANDEAVASEEEPEERDAMDSVAAPKPTGAA